MNPAPTTANATFCATLADQLVADGLTHAFLAPGSRSTPLALALLANPAITVTLFHDERGAAFAALGHGLANGRPALVACTSGTAAAHFYAAVIEADLSAVGLIVCTADRPPELWGRGAPQTIDQTELYGTRVRAFIEPGPPDDTDPSTWRAIARRMWTCATGPRPGPVHANLSFRDPLTGSAATLPPPVAALEAAAPPSPDPAVIAQLVARLDGRSGVIVAGRAESDGAAIVELGARLGWPIVADHRSGCRDPEAPHVLRHFDAVLRNAQFVADHRVQVVLRLGEVMASKVTSQWLSACDADILAGRPHGRHIDPEDINDFAFDESGVVTGLLGALPETARGAPQWLESWMAADALAVAAIDAELLGSLGGATEVDVARCALQAVPEGGALFVSSSMPVRDLEWYAPHRNDIDVFSNRGANGIDGVVATAIGVATSGRPTVCLIGDVAFLHDSSSLTALRSRPIDLTIVVIDNDGGGIFSFLPQHTLLEHQQYEFLFGTPHGTDIAALAQAHGIEVAPWPADLTPAGVRVVVATSDRDANLALHNRLNQAVAAGLTAGALRGR